VSIWTSACGILDSESNASVKRVLGWSHRATAFEAAALHYSKINLKSGIDIGTERRQGARPIRPGGWFRPADGVAASRRRMALLSSTTLARTSAVLAVAVAMLLQALSGSALAQGGNGGSDQYGDPPGRGETVRTAARAAMPHPRLQGRDSPPVVAAAAPVEESGGREQPII
jgi:hypothetical protein